MTLRCALGPFERAVIYYFGHLGLVRSRGRYESKLKKNTTSWMREKDSMRQLANKSTVEPSTLTAQVANEERSYCNPISMYVLYKDTSAFTLGHKKRKNREKGIDTREPRPRVNSISDTAEKVQYYANRESASPRTQPVPGPVAFQANPVHAREIPPSPAYAYASAGMTAGMVSFKPSGSDTWSTKVI